LNNESGNVLLDGYTENEVIINIICRLLCRLLIHVMNLISGYQYINVSIFLIIKHKIIKSHKSVIGLSIKSFL